MHDLLFDNQQHLKPAQLRSYAEQLQLDVARYTAEMDDQVYLQRIREHMEGARHSGVRGTPTFFVNGERLESGSEYNDLIAAVEAALG